jgi:hypothetical protein
MSTGGLMLGFMGSLQLLLPEESDVQFIGKVYGQANVALQYGDNWVRLIPEGGIGLGARFFGMNLVATGGYAPLFDPVALTFEHGFSAGVSLELPQYMSGFSIETLGYPGSNEYWLLAIYNLLLNS